MCVCVCDGVVDSSRAQYDGRRNFSYNLLLSSKLACGSRERQSFLPFVQLPRSSAYPSVRLSISSQGLGRTFVGVENAVFVGFIYRLGPLIKRFVCVCVCVKSSKIYGNLYVHCTLRDTELGFRQISFVRTKRHVRHVVRGDGCANRLVSSRIRIR